MAVALDTLTLRVTGWFGALIAIIDAVLRVADTQRLAGSSLTDTTSVVAQLSVTDDFLSTCALKIAGGHRAVVAVIGAGSSQADFTSLHAASRSVTLSGSTCTQSASTNVLLNALPSGVTTPKGAFVVIVRAIRRLAAVVDFANSCLTSSFALLAQRPVGQGHRKTRATNSASIHSATLLRRRTGIDVTNRSLGLANTVATAALAMIAGTTLGLV